MSRRLRLVLLCGALLLLPRPGNGAEAPDFSGRRISAVDIVGPAGFETKELKRFLEVRVGDEYSGRQVRRAIEVLAKLGDFRSITVHAELEADGVHLTFQLRPNPRIARITMTGGRKVPARIAAAMGVSTGDPYPGEESLARMAEDVRMAYEREGWKRAQVGVRALPGDGDVSIEVEVELGIRQNLSEIHVAGDSAFEEAELIAESGIEPGDPFRDTEVESARRRLLRFHRKTGFLEARVPQALAHSDTNGHVTLTLVVNSGERIEVKLHKKNVAWADKKRMPLWWWEFRDTRLLGSLELDNESNFTEGFADEAADRITAYYRRRGFLEAKVRGEFEVQAAKRVKTFRFDIDPGRRFKLRRVVFRGNDETKPELKSRVLREEFAAQAKSIKDKRYVLEDVEVATNHLVNYLRSEGYAEAEVIPEDPVIDRMKHTVDLVFDVEPGPRSRVGTVEFVGNAQTPEKVLAAIVAQPPLYIREGNPLNGVYLDKADAAIVEHYSTGGFPYAVARHTATLGTSGKVNIRFDVDESFQAYVGRVIVKGNRYTRREVIDRALPLRTGQVYSPEALASSEDALLKLGVFSRVVAVPFEEEEPERVRDVLIGVSETNRFVLEPSVGASSDDGPRLGLRFQRRNLFGSAKSISVRAQANWRWDGFLGPTRGIDEVPGPAVDYSKIGVRMLVTYAQPTTFGLPVASSATTSLFETERRRNYGFDGNRLIAASSRDLKIHRGMLRGSTIAFVGRYQFFLRDMKHDSRGEPVADRQAKVALEPPDLSLPKPQQQFYFPFQWKIAGASFGTLLDGRNDRFNPTEGYAVSLNTELDSRALGSDVEFAKVSGAMSFYRPLVAGFVFAATARGGYAVPFGKSEGVPIDQRFHLGGTGSVRGFLEETIGPRFEAVHDRSTGGDVFGLYNLELRRPLVGGLDWVIFHDAGTTRILRTSTKTSPLYGDLVNPQDLSTSIGLGIRLGTPVGPVKFDVGIDTTKIEETRSVDKLPNLKMHFTIGDF